MDWVLLLYSYLTLIKFLTPLPEKICGNIGVKSNFISLEIFLLISYAIFVLFFHLCLCVICFIVFRFVHVLLVSIFLA